MNNKAKAYGNKFSKVNRATKSSFTPKPGSTSSAIPTAPPKEKTKKETPPTYKFVDAQKGNVDDTAEQHGKEDEKLREDKGKAPESAEQATTTFKKPEKIVKDNQPDVQPHTTTTVAGEEFTAFWHLEETYDIEEETFESINSWTPNALALFELLKATSSLVTEARIVYKHHPEYIDYATVVYYSYLFYVQILRAREAANQMTGEERTFLRRFRASFPEETLVIAKPMFAFFGSIVSTMTPDSRFNWIVPRIDPEILNSMTTTTRGTTTTNVINETHGAMHLQPMLPYMIGILRFATSKYANLHLFDTVDPADSSSDPIFFDDEDRFQIGNPDIDFEAFGFTFGRTGHGTSPYKLFASMGLRHPFNTGSDAMSLIWKQWRATAFNKNVRFTARASDPDLETMSETHVSGLLNFLCAPKAKNLDWFRTLLNNAVTHARFFGDAKNLSEVAVTGGYETLLVGKIYRMNALGRRETEYTDENVGMTDATFNWYPSIWDVLGAEFETTRAGLEREHVLQAITFASNSSIPINITTGTGATRKTFRVGTSTGSMQVDGEYWLDNTITASMFKDSHRAKPLFRGWETLAQTTWFTHRPSGY